MDERERSLMCVPTPAIFLESRKAGTVMRPGRTAPTTIDDYVAAFPDRVQKSLQKIRMTIRRAAPDAEETISYQIPTFTLKGRHLIYFAAFKKHIGLYPAPIGNAEFKEDLSAYAAGKGTLRFPLDEPIPFDLIRKIVTFRAKQNVARAETKRKKRLTARA